MDLLPLLKSTAHPEQWHFYHPQLGWAATGHITLLACGSHPACSAQTAASDVVTRGIVGAAAHLAAALTKPALRARCRRDTAVSNRHVWHHPVPTRAAFCLQEGPASSLTIMTILTPWVDDALGHACVGFMVLHGEHTAARYMWLLLQHMDTVTLSVTSCYLRGSSSARHPSPHQIQQQRAQAQPSGAAPEQGTFAKRVP